MPFKAGGSGGNYASRCRYPTVLRAVLPMSAQRIGLVLQLAAYTTKTRLSQLPVPSMQLIVLHAVALAAAPPISLSAPTAAVRPSVNVLLVLSLCDAHCMRKLPHPNLGQLVIVR